MPEPGQTGREGSSTSTGREGPGRGGEGRGRATGKSRGGYSGAGPKAAARDPGSAFAGGVGEGRGYDPFGPNTWQTGMKAGGLLGVPGMVAGGLWGAANQFGLTGVPEAPGRRGGGTLGGPPGGGFDPGSRDGGGGDMLSRFQNWQAGGNQGSFRDFIGSGGNINPATGQPLYPGTIDYANAVTPGYSPAVSAPLYGPGSPYAGPQALFGG